jgi:hypothetical protein
MYTNLQFFLLHNYYVVIQIHVKGRLTSDERNEARCRVGLGRIRRAMHGRLREPPPSTDCHRRLYIPHVSCRLGLIRI